MKYAEIFKTLLTPTIAIIAVCIAWLQYKNVRYKIKLDLYEKRYKVYLNIINMCGVVFREYDIKPDDIKEYHTEMQEVEFLFKKGVKNYINDFHKKMMRFTALKTKLKQANVNQEAKEKSIQELSEVSKWIIEQPKIITTKFKPYLNFKNLK